jgi:hypothetical protein
MITTKRLLLIMAFGNFVLAIQAIGWLTSHVVAASYTEPPATMIMTERPEPLLLIIAAGNFGLAIMGLFTPHIVAASVVLDCKDGKKNFTDGNGELKVLTLTKKELEWLRTVHAPTIAENANEIVAACYHLKEFGARLDPFYRPLQPV